MWWMMWQAPQGAPSQYACIPASNQSATVGTGVTRALSRKLGNATSAIHRSASAHSPSAML